MAILDYLTGKRSKRARAARLLETVSAPFDRLRAAIREAGTAQAGADFETLWQRFTDCRLYRPADLTSLPSADLDRLDRFVASQIAPARPTLDAVRAALEQVAREWRGDDLVTAATGGGLRALAQFDELAGAATPQDRLLRTAALVEIDLACADVKGELAHIAKSPALFW